MTSAIDKVQRAKNYRTPQALRSLSSKYFNIACRIIFRQPIKDYTSSIFVMKRYVMDEVTFLGYGHGEFFIEFLVNAYKKGFKIKPDQKRDLTKYYVEQKQSPPGKEKVDAPSSPSFQDARSGKEKVENFRDAPSSPPSFQDTRSGILPVITPEEQV